MNKTMNEHEAIEIIHRQLFALRELYYDEEQMKTKNRDEVVRWILDALAQLQRFTQGDNPPPTNGGERVELAS